MTSIRLRPPALQPLLTRTSLQSQAFFFFSILSAAIFLYLFGFEGVLRSAPFGIDFDVFYRAGQLLNAGINPWRVTPDPMMLFSYPPHSASLISFYGALPHQLSLTLHVVFNFFGIATLAYLANRWFIKVEGLRDCSLLSACCVFLIIGNPIIAKSLYLGQFSLPCIAAALLSWQFKKSHKPILAGIFLGIATLKPQVSMLYVLWLILERDVKILSVGASLALLMMTPALIAFGPVETFLGWFSSIEDYMKVPFNMPGSNNVVGLESAFTSFGIYFSSFKLLAVLAIVMLYLYRRKFTDIQIVSLFSILSLTFIYGHDADYVAVALFVSYFLYLGITTKSNTAILLAFSIVVLFYFPAQLHKRLGFHHVHVVTTFLLILMFLLTCKWEKFVRAEQDKDTGRAE